MTKQDAITVLSKLGTQVVEMTINDSNFIKKSAAWCLEYLESKKEIFEMDNTIELILPNKGVKIPPIETINREMILASDDAIFYYHMGTMQPNYRELGILSDWEKWFENIQKDKNIRWAAIKRNYSSQIQPRKGLNLIIR